MAKLEELIDDELERAGFSTSSLVRWVSVTLLCVLLLVAVVATGQKLFFQTQLQGPAQLIASLISSVGVVISQISGKVNEERHIKASIDKAERSVAKD